ncbi:hypothetical protein [Actinoplanes sp. NPDC026670]|uniref:hypothetical protein n=1 Tax=Actinoplanes sp. NPDC026670 TaxID=3154700 RepID=UPI0033F55FF4
MAIVTLGAAVLVYVALAVAWRVRDRVDRAAAAVLPSIEIDPYHVRATAGSPADMDEAAAASLLLAGRVTVDEQGLLSPAGYDEEPPAHPVEAVLMDALHRGERPLALRRLRSFTAADERTAAFLREQDARVPRWADREGDALITTAVLTGLALGFAGLAPFLLLGEDHPGGFGFAVFRLICFGLPLGLVLAFVAVQLWPLRHDYFQRHCAQLPPHPALEALDTEQRNRLRASVQYVDPPDTHQESWADSGGAF